MSNLEFEETVFEPKPAHAYIVGKRKQVAEDNTISAEKLEEIKEYMRKYFGGSNNDNQFSNY